MLTQTPEYIAVLTRGFEQLGPDRVRRAVAGRSTTCTTWVSCFLAQAYSYRGKLDAELRKISNYGVTPVADLLGIGVEEARVISDAHTFAQDDLYRLAEEWLEDVEVPHATPVPSHQ